MVVIFPVALIFWIIWHGSPIIRHGLRSSDDLAEIGLVPLGVQTFKGTSFGEFELVLVELAENAGLVSFVFEHEFVKVILMHIRDVLHEQHDEDVILVLGRVHGVTECVTGFPEDVVDIVLGDGGGCGEGNWHRFIICIQYFWLIIFAYASLLRSIPRWLCQV